MDVTIHPLKDSDLQDAEKIFRLAFGTFLGVPDPKNFSIDKAFIRNRWHAVITAAFGAEVNGRLVGSNIATKWGSIGFFGPLTVLPAYWNRGVGKLLMEPVVNTLGDFLLTFDLAVAIIFSMANEKLYIDLFFRTNWWWRSSY